MEKIVYVVCHCSADEQSESVNLTSEESRQVAKLAAFFDGIAVDRIISSPFVKAQETAWAIGRTKGVHIEQDSRLSERKLSSHDFRDRLVKLEDAFLNLHLKYEGGESSIEAMTRVCRIVEKLGAGSRTVLVTHRELMILLLRCFDERFGFEEWQALTNPDVFRIREKDDEYSVKRVWSDVAINQYYEIE